MNKTTKQTAVIVLDGWGYREEREHNAIAEASTPFFDYLWKTFPHTLVDASEEKVGLPTGQMGNSEIGHMTIGAGKIIDTDLVRIDKSIRNGEFQKNGAFAQLFDHVKKNCSVLHVIGLLSPGGIHSHAGHLHAFLSAAKAAGVEKIAIHAITDGRDTAPQSAAGYLEELEKVIEELGVGFIATASGRFYAMDRDHNWDRLAKAEAAFYECEGNVCHKRKPSEYVRELHAAGVLDEHLEPVVFLDENGKGYPIQKNDGVLMYNFRADRARMMAQKFAERGKAENICFVTMTEYDRSVECLVAFPPIGIETTLAAEVSKAGLRQAHIAETEKYAHATYFLNGGKEEPHEGEEHVLVESRKDVKTHDQAPEMRAKEIADEAVARIESGVDFLFINFANPDMVGHTANYDAIKNAIETVDRELKRVVTALTDRNGVALVTADHGNAEVNVDQKTGEKHTAHTTNPVPFIVTDQAYSIMEGGSLADIAPTALKVMGLPQPKSMTGSSRV